MQPSKPFQGPPRLTKGDILARRQQAKVLRKVKRVQLKAQLAETLTTTFPHKVTLRKKGKFTEEQRMEMRAWLLGQNMRPYNTASDASQRADVTWDKDWKVFSFRHQWHATMFAMVWLEHK